MLDPEKVLSLLPTAHASKNHSRDSRTKVGAIILDPEYGIVSSGWNGFPRGVKDHMSARYDPPLKYKWTVHAETNAIANAARRGIALKDCEMLVAGNVICAQCCAIAIQAGIKSIHTPQFDIKNIVHARLEDDYLIAVDMMIEANIRHVQYKSDSGAAIGHDNLINGITKYFGVL